jgi:hypothetical protein
MLYVVSRVRRSQWSLACRNCGFEFRRGMDVRLLWVLCVLRLRSLRQIDLSSRGVLLSLVRRCGWYRTLKNEEGIARFGSRRHKKHLEFWIAHSLWSNSPKPDFNKTCVTVYKIRRKVHIYVYRHVNVAQTNNLEQVRTLEARGFQLVKKFPAVFGSRRYITFSETAWHLSLTWSRRIQSTPTHSTF